VYEANIPHDNDELLMSISPEADEVDNQMGKEYDN
jgi:hypothetical protein